MSDGTAIEWTDATWNPVRARRITIESDGSGRERIGWHCEHVSEGCRNCYAERINRWQGTGQEFKPAHLKHSTQLGDERGDVTVFLDRTMLVQPMKWSRPRRIFVCSMTDLFADFVPDETIDKVFAVMALTPWHTYQVLTKRVERMRRYFTKARGLSRWHDIDEEARKILLEERGERLPPAQLLRGPFPNVWIGASAEDQGTLDERINDLIDTPAKVRFLSLEPLLGGIEMFLQGRPGISWVIVGGESGPGARPVHPDWVRSIRDQCERQRVAFFFKQWGEWRAPTSAQAATHLVKTDGTHVARVDALQRSAISGRIEDLVDRGHQGWARICRPGKAAAGRLLDGKEYSQWPTP